MSNIRPSGLLFYNFSSQSWKNSSSAGYYDGTYVATYSGDMQFVPNWGGSGLLVVLGGQSVLTGNTNLWSKVTIFDPATQLWHAQTATGDVPSARSGFCNVGIGEQSRNGTFEIFVYGGYDGGSASPDEAAQVGDSVYVLSLPAFQWFRANATSNDPRIYHTCNLAGKRQMLSVGGVNPALSGTTEASVWNGANVWTSEQWNTTDPYLFNLKVLDLTDLEWTNTFDPAAEVYVAPQIVQDFYAGEIKYPSRWNEDSLKSLFMAQPANHTGSNTTNTPPASTTTSSTAFPGGQSHTGAIVGGVVGGVVGLILVTAAIWFFCVRKPKQKAAAAGPATRPLMFEKDSRDVMKVGELSSPPPPRYPHMPGGPMLGGELSSERTTMVSDCQPSAVYEMPTGSQRAELAAERSMRS